MDYLDVVDDLFKKYKFIKDNDPCLCGSRKSFKDCHKLSDIQNHLDLYEIQKDALKIFTKKTCYYQDENCSAINTYSHSIPRASLLTISHNNHVLSFKSPNIPELKKMACFNQLRPSEIGINEASSFYGFCSHHDNQVFSPIEKQYIEPTEEQDCLLLFRALCRELYISSENIKMMAICRQIIESKDDIDYKHILNVKNILDFLCMHKIISEILNDYNLLVSDLRGKLLNGYSSITIITDKPPPINCCAYINPPFSLDGSIYQNYNDLSIDTDSFSFTVFTSNGKGYFHFCWNKNTNSSKFFEIMDSIDNNKIVDLLIQMIFAYTENLAFSKEWWSNLHVQKRKHLLKLFFSYGMNQSLQGNPADEFYDMGFSNLSIVDIKRR